MTTEDNYRMVCRNIRYLRAAHGLSRTAMARRLHITIKTLDAMEAGIFPERTGIQLLFHVFQAFGVSPSQLTTTSLEDQPHL